MHDIMVDIESLGTRHDAVILSIGAVKFDGREVIDKFYTKIDPVDCMKRGLTVSVDSVAWWMNQPDEVRLDMFDKTSALPSLENALKTFSDWCGWDSDYIWARGSDFDFPILANAFRSVGVTCPWDYAQVRDLRTLETAASPFYVQPFRGGGYTDHHALHDAEYQAECAIAAFKALDKSKKI